MSVLELTIMVVVMDKEHGSDAWLNDSARRRERPGNTAHAPVLVRAHMGTKVMAC